ncbi:unnamed protein product [Urochloa humidicola]
MAGSPGSRAALGVGAWSFGAAVPCGIGVLAPEGGRAKLAGASARGWLCSQGRSHGVREVLGSRSSDAIDLTPGVKPSRCVLPRHPPLSKEAAATKEDPPLRSAPSLDGRPQLDYGQMQQGASCWK